MPRTGSGGRGDILNADVRPYRDNAAAASDKDGRGVDHGRGYKAAPGFRQPARLGNEADSRPMSFTGQSGHAARF
jgi:hypothetical protein